MTRRQDRIECPNGLAGDKDPRCGLDARPENEEQIDSRVKWIPLAGRGLHLKMTGSP